MKKIGLLILLAITLLSTACQSVSKEKVAETTSNTKTLEDYKNKVDIKYFGINGKVFNYEIVNDDKKVCSIKDGKYKNGDKLSISCVDSKLGINFNKEIVVKNLLEDDVKNTNIIKVIENVAINSKYYLVKQDEYGFSFILFNQLSSDIYEVKNYYSVFFNDKLVTISDFSKDKLYEKNEIEPLSKPTATLSDVKSQYLDELINKYVSQGFVKYEMKSN